MKKEGLQKPSNGMHPSLEQTLRAMNKSIIFVLTPERSQSYSKITHKSSNFSYWRAGAVLTTFSWSKKLSKRFNRKSTINVDVRIRFSMRQNAVGLFKPGTVIWGQNVEKSNEASNPHIRVQMQSILENHTRFLKFLFVHFKYYYWFEKLSWSGNRIGSITVVVKVATRAQE